MPPSIASFPDRGIATGFTHGHAGWACPQSQPSGESSAAFLDPAWPGWESPGLRVKHSASTGAVHTP